AVRRARRPARRHPAPAFRDRRRLWRRDPARAHRARARCPPGSRRGRVPCRPRRAATDAPPRCDACPRFHPTPRRHPPQGGPLMRGNIAQLMQQAQKMQENMQRAQEELAQLEVTGSAGGGMVSVTLTGRMECRKVRIDPSVISDPEMTEDLVAAAFNHAVNKANAASQEKLGAATAGMPLPPGMKLPF